ncbi:MAG: type II secretion system protein [Bacilli bacterium]|nr:type II secretion system protein [Bacilli bacterium]
MKKNAFTLIELIAVIVILGFILVIIMPTLTDTLNRTKDKLNNTQKNQILSASRNWGMENLNDNTNKTDRKITIKDLQDSGFLDDKEVKNLKNKTNLQDNTTICIKYKDNQYVYYYEGDTIEGDKKCTK